MYVLTYRWQKLKHSFFNAHPAFLQVKPVILRVWDTMGHTFYQVAYEFFYHPTISYQINDTTIRLLDKCHTIRKKFKLRPEKGFASIVQKFVKWVLSECFTILRYIHTFLQNFLRNLIKYKDSGRCNVSSFEIAKLTNFV